MIEKELFKLKKDIEEAKTELAKLEGSKATLMEQLEANYGCKSIAAAEKKLVKLREKNTKLTEQIETSLQEIEDKYIKD